MRQREVFVFWLPLFASWLLMASEGPLITAAINRLPNEIVMLAAMGIVFSLEVAIESPIINLLATSTALVHDRASFVVVRRFTLRWIVGLTLVAAAIAFTPLFDLVVIDLMGTPADVARWVRVGLRLMVPWTAAIAWRRFLQGVLISFSETRKVAWGTAIRLTGSASTAIGLALWGEVSGVVLGSVALVVGVVAEALYATMVVRPLLRSQLAPEADPAATPLTERELLRFHLPLASTSVLTLMIQPLVAACLARLDQPVSSLAAWPIVFQLMLFMRAAAFALPEAVIALSKREGTQDALRRFTITLTVVSGLAMLLFSTTPLAFLYLERIQSTSEVVATLAHTGFLVLIPLPPLTVLVSWLRGVLIHRRRTTSVNEAMILRLVVTVLALGTGLLLSAPGIPTASVALTLSLALELAWLWWREVS